MPDVAAAFGSYWRSLRRYDNGWQRADIGPPWPHQWPTAGIGPQPLADLTDAPVLAAWVYDTTCIQFAAATPGGTPWSVHFVPPGDDGECGWDHVDLDRKSTRLNSSHLGIS